MMLGIPSGACLAAFLMAGSAHGAVTLVAQERSISGFAHAEWLPGLPTEEDSFAESAPDFSPFDIYRSITVRPPNHPNRPADASAEQHSALSESLIVATGRATAGTLGTPPEQYGLAESRFSVTFDVDEASPFHLVGSVFLAQVGTLPTVGVAMLELTGPGVSFSRSLTSFGTLSLDETGVLAPGRYTLAARTSSDIREAPTFYADGTFSASLTIVPAPGACALIGMGACFAARRRRAL